MPNTSAENDTLKARLKLDEIAQQANMFRDKKNAEERQKLIMEKQIRYQGLYDRLFEEHFSTDPQRTRGHENANLASISEKFVSEQGGLGYQNYKSNMQDLMRFCILYSYMLSDYARLGDRAANLMTDLGEYGVNVPVPILGSLPGVGVILGIPYHILSGAAKKLGLFQSVNQTIEIHQDAPKRLEFDETRNTFVMKPIDDLFVKGVEPSLIRDTEMMIKLMASAFLISKGYEYNGTNYQKDGQNLTSEKFNQLILDRDEGLNKFMSHSLNGSFLKAQLAFVDHPVNAMAKGIESQPPNLTDHDKTPTPRF